MDWVSRMTILLHSETLQPRCNLSMSRLPFAVHLWNMSAHVQLPAVACATLCPIRA